MAPTLENLNSSKSVDPDVIEARKGHDCRRWLVNISVGSDLLMLVMPILFPGIRPVSCYSRDVTDFLF